MKESAAVYKIENYGRKSAFASFLPGISGVKGIPLWCYYVNRGQGVVSFGVENKDHAIMEFYPAHQAYQNVKITGFRTFVKKGGAVLEPFQDETVPHSMSVSMNGLKIEECNEKEGLRTRVSYFTLPGERIAALVRKVSITNISGEAVSLEILDGMPACIPYGIDHEGLKMMGQTLKAWMQVDRAGNIPYMKARASTADSTAVAQVLGGNFSLGSMENGMRLKAITDPEVIFSYDLSLQKPVGFTEHGVRELEQMPEVSENLVPCCFYGMEAELRAGEETVLYELFGQVENKELLLKFSEKTLDAAYYERKKQEADSLTDNLCRQISTKTADPNFDAYCRYTYLDNVLRGGYPIKLAENKVFYVYSRKHGDLERDYNFFSMLPEFYSQGNGNFRDVNQNRRCDTFFNPFVGEENIRTFYSLIQPDGYNPLGVEKVTYRLKEEKAEEIFRAASKEARRHLIQTLARPFTPGALYRELDGVWEAEQQKDALFAQVMREAEGVVNGRFLEGYWSDHWTYNLDLLENYLSVFPEKEEELLYGKNYNYYMPQAKVRKRAGRCVKTERGIRQYRAIDRTEAEDGTLMRADCGKGGVIFVTLMEKLLLLSVTKFTTLDAYGMGVEMEGGKPGWYDALNGLPGLFGSSMAETCELARNLEYTIQALKRYPKEVELSKEVAEFIRQTERIAAQEEQALLNRQKVLSFWNKVNDAKEDYRKQVERGFTGETASLSSAYLVNTLEKWHAAVCAGIKKACDMNGGICPTYFTFEVTKYDEYKNGEETCVMPLDFEVRTVPLFLEGPVRYLKLDNTAGTKKTMYEQVKKSDLYDGKLSMYKVNASLEGASYELGRAKAFTPGWLENESVWLHMEYKYLLELLKSGMYEEFFEDFHNAAIPFLDEEVYGRSIYENSSFIASSKNPNGKYHGKGFVARLSGSTVEFLNMWTILMFGQKPFAVKEGELVLKLEPALPSYLVEAGRTVEAVFLGETRVIYHIGEQKDYIPGGYRIAECELEYKDGSILRTERHEIKGKPARDVRDGLVKEINITLF